jgi:hypothetical protein
LCIILIGPVLGFLIGALSSNKVRKTRVKRR